MATKTSPGIGDFLLHSSKSGRNMIVEIMEIFITDSCSFINYKCKIMFIIGEKGPAPLKGTIAYVTNYDLWINCNLEEIPSKYPEVYI